MSKAIFNHILDKTKRAIEKQDVIGDTILPAKRLAVALHRFCRGSYYYDIAELYGIGELLIKSFL